MISYNEYKKCDKKSIDEMLVCAHLPHELLADAVFGPFQSVLGPPGGVQVFVRRQSLGESLLHVTHVYTRTYDTIQIT